jgi:hypothetical protein
MCRQCWNLAYDAGSKHVGRGSRGTRIRKWIGKGISSVGWRLELVEWNLEGGLWQWWPCCSTWCVKVSFCFFICLLFVQCDCHGHGPGAVSGSSKLSFDSMEEVCVLFVVVTSDMCCSSVRKHLMHVFCIIMANTWFSWQLKALYTTAAVALVDVPVTFYSFLVIVCRVSPATAWSWF